MPTDRLVFDTASVAYAAGLFEGEGSAFASQRFGVAGQPIRKERKLVIAMCDREPLDKFVEAVKVGRVNGPYVKNDGRTRPMYQWQVSSLEHVQHVVAILWPHLGPRRREQCVRALRLEVSPRVH